MANFQPKITNNADGTRTASYMGRNIKIYDSETKITPELFGSAVKNWDKAINACERAEKKSKSSMSSGRSIYMKARGEEFKKLAEAHKRTVQEMEEKLKARGITMGSGRSEYYREMAAVRNGSIWDKMASGE